MVRERLYYLFLWIIAVIAMSVPWATANGKTYSGWNFVVPFSFFYVIGLLLGLIVLLTKFHPFALSLVAGICMFLGVIGGLAGFELMELTGELAGKTVESHGGIGFAFVWSIVYTLVGSFLGKRMIKKGITKKEQEKQQG